MAGRISSARTAAHFERQLQQHGEKSLRTSLKNIAKNLEQHQAKIEEATAAGRPTSSMDREVRTFERQIQAIREILNRLEKDELRSRHFPPIDKK